MIENNENLNQFQIMLIPFILNLISKISENSFYTIVLKCKKMPFLILYISSIFSSIVLNLIFILIGIGLRYFLKTNIINDFFLLIIFILYCLMAFIQIGQVFSSKGEEDNKIIDYIINSSSSDDESEKPKIHINSDNNEVEIELDNIKLDEIDDQRKNNNFSNFTKKTQISENKNLHDSNYTNFYECIKMIISAEFGEKVQIFNIGLSSRFKNIIYLIPGNICVIIIINATTPTIIPIIKPVFDPLLLFDLLTVVVSSYISLYKILNDILSKLLPSSTSKYIDIFSILDFVN